MLSLLHLPLILAAAASAASASASTTVYDKWTVSFYKDEFCKTSEIQVYIDNTTLSCQNIDSPVTIYGAQTQFNPKQLCPVLYEEPNCAGAKHHPYYNDETQNMCEETTKGFRSWEVTTDCPKTSDWNPIGPCERC
ncbi:hypothetical protein VTN96DRAFT_7561 [Rasamsonia emersonii]